MNRQVPKIGFTLLSFVVMSSSLPLNNKHFKISGFSIDHVQYITFELTDS